MNFTINKSIIQIEIMPENKNLSKTQKQFNKIIKSIEIEKKSLLAWQNMMPEFNTYRSEFITLQKEHSDNFFSLIKTFDLAYDNSYFKKSAKKKIKHLVLDLIEELIDEIDESKKIELKNIYNKYSDDDFDKMQEEQEKDEAELMKGFFENIFGFDFGNDVDINSPEKLEEAVKKQMKEEQEEIEKQQQLKDEKYYNRKKTPKQIAKEEAKINEEQNISKSIKEIYRKLASVLHPDLEQDEFERERKTKLMQEINAAYAGKDLLRLLELQLEVEQIDQSQLNNIAEDRLKYIVKILREQLNDLREEIREKTYTFEMMIGEQFTKITPSEVLKAIKSDIKQLKNKILLMKKDLKNFQNPKELKIFLDEYKIPKKSDVDDFEDFEDLFF